MSYKHAVSIVSAIDRRISKLQPSEISKQRLYAFVAGYWGKIPLCAKVHIDRMCNT